MTRMIRFGHVLLISLFLNGGAALAQFGATISPPEFLNTNAETDAGQDWVPQIVTDGLGNWVAVWESTDTLGGTIGADVDILVARSSDNGETWTPPAALNTNAATDSGHDRYPHIATDGGGNWVVVWQSFDTLGGTVGNDWDIFVARSTNNGATWSSPETLNTNADTDAGADVFPQIAADGSGVWVVVWQSNDTLGATIGNDQDILFSRSIDDGVTWSDPEPLNTNADTDAGHDYGPRLAADGLGNWIVVWQSNDTLGNTIGGDFDILFARSDDDGQTWSAPAVLNTNADTDSGGDFHPHVAADGSGNWIVVWESNDTLGGTVGNDYDIFLSVSADDGQTWSTPAALNTNADTDHTEQSSPPYDGLPRIATDAQGNWVVVWQTTGHLGNTIDLDWDLLVARSDDDGATWTDPEPLNTNADTDAGADNRPALAADGAGNWVVVWYSTDTLESTIGADPDILVARFELPGALRDDTGADGIDTLIRPAGGVSPMPSDPRPAPRE
jgi:predicted neuraminidase